MHHILEIFYADKARFRRLSKNVHLLLLTIILSGIINPILGVFSNAFLWANNQSFTSVATYNFGFFIGLPIGFIILGKLLPFFPIKKLFGISTVFMCLVAASLMIFAPESNHTILLFGLGYGITSGLYWSARNILTLRLTTLKNRDYYWGIEVSTGAIVGTIAPFVIGLLLSSTTLIHVFTQNGVYIVLAFGSLCISGLLYYTTQQIDYVLEQKNVPIFVKDKTPYWKRVLILNMMEGIQSSVTYFIPSLVVLYFLGNERILGIFESLSAIIAAILVYVLGRSMTKTNRIHILSFGVAAIAMVSFTFFALFNDLGALVYLLIYPFAMGVVWLTLGPIRYDAIEKASGQGLQQHFGRFVEAEISINIGRVLGIGVFFVLVYVSSEQIALQISPLIVSLMFTAVLIVAKKVEESG